MVRFITFLTAAVVGVTAILAGFSGLALAAGRAAPRDVVVTITASPNLNRHRFQLIEPAANLRLDIPMPLDEISYLDLSPDGTHALMLVQTNITQLYLYDILSRQLYPTQGDYNLSRWEFRWAADGHSLMAMNKRGVTPQETSAPSWLTLSAFYEDDQTEDASTSPNGQWQAVIAADANGYTENLLTGERYPLVIPDAGFEIDLEWISWSPDSEALVFSVFTNEQRTASRLYLTDARFQTLKLLTYNAIAPNWSPDGRFLIVRTWNSMRTQFHGIFYLLPIAQPLPEGQHPPLLDTFYTPRWAANGDYFLYVQTGNMNMARPGSLVLVHAETDSRRMLTEGGEYVVSYAYWR